MDKEIVKDVISKATPSQTMKSSSNYLETREAMSDYAKILEKFAGAGTNEVKKAWADHVAQKGISNVEALLPWKSPGVRVS